MFGGVHGVPEDVRVWVCADGVVVATSEAAQERWTLVAVGCSVCEAHLHDSKPCQQPAAVKWRSPSKHSNMQAHSNITILSTAQHQAATTA